ncbi:uncharacterized protein [Solanum tuberosum]|nr:PREDICTED: uncharacterized protein LOC107061207 [Solanum tuberosum]
MNGIDLNISIEVDDSSGVAQYIPDLNIIVDSLPSPSFNSSNSIDEPSSVNQISFDLNTELSAEDDIPFDSGPQTTHEEPHINIDSNGSDDEELSQSSSTPRELSNDKRIALYEMLLAKSVNGKLGQGVRKMVASHFSVSLRTVYRIWKQSGYGTQNDVSRRKAKNCGRKRIEIDMNRFREIPLRKRTTLRTLACSLDVNKSTLGRRLKGKEIQRHSNTIKPFLTEQNKISRLQFCLSMVDRDSIPDDPSFIDMYNIVHIDEKWFYMTKKKQTYYMLPGEEEQLRSCKSSNYILKIMFLVALARPRIDALGNVLFCGKIGIWPFVIQEEAQRGSVNRPAGTLETKPISVVNRDVIRSFLIDKVIPSIKEKWPIGDSTHPIYIQQDNARTHVKINDDEFRQVASQDGFDIRLMCQPPNSPDMNVLDLGFFSAIQALQHQEAPKNIDELISVVTNAYEVFPERISNRIFLTLQSCMKEIMRIGGFNKYNIPHIKKEILQRTGQLPISLKCDSELVNDVMNRLPSSLH